MRRYTARAAGPAARLLAAATIVLAAAGCSVLEPRPDDSRYFVLRSTAESTGTPPLEGLVLGLGPVTVPDHLDRFEMIEPVDAYEMRYSSRNRWLEPLGTQLRRTLAENLELLLKPDRIVEYPWFATDGVALRVEVDFGALTADADGRWSGPVRWVVRDAATRAARERGDFVLELGSVPMDPDRVARTLSEELRRLGEEVAGAVRRSYADPDEQPEPGEGTR